MKNLCPTLLALALAVATPAFAGHPGEAKATTAASAPQGCGQAVKSHVHGSEQGKGPNTAKPAKGAAGCGAADASSKDKANAETVHSHGKMHKGQ